MKESYNINPSYKKIGLLSRAIEVVRYNYKSLTDKNFKADVRLAQNGVLGETLSPAQIKNILTYQRAKHSVSNPLLENQRSELLRSAQIQDIDASILIIGKMGVLKGKNEIDIGLDEKGFLKFSTTKEFGVPLWRDAKFKDLESAVRSIASASAIPLKWYSEFFDPSECNIETADNIKEIYKNLETNFTKELVYNQHFENLSSLRSEAVSESIHMFVDVNRSYLSSLGLVEKDDSMKSVPVKLIGYDDDIVILEGFKSNGIGKENINIPMEQYNDFIGELNCKKISEIDKGISLYEVNGVFKIKFKEENNIIGLNEFNVRKDIPLQIREKVLNDFYNQNYLLEDKKVVLTDDIQEVLIREHKDTGKMYFNTKHGTYGSSKDVKLDSKSFNQIFKKMNRPNNLHVFKYLSNKTGFEIIKPELKKNNKINR